MMRVCGKSTLQNFSRTLLSRHYSQQPSANKVTSPNGNVPGLSSKCVDVPNNPVGPGASKSAEYKNPEYFCYNATSFAEAEVEMARFRLQQPSNKKKIPAK